MFSTIRVFLLLLTIGLFTLPADGGPISVGLCYTSCNAAAMACYAGFGVLGPHGRNAKFTEMTVTIK